MSPGRSGVLAIEPEVWVGVAPAGTGAAGEATW